jgi:hypothetical protein
MDKLPGIELGWEALLDSISWNVFKWNSLPVLHEATSMWLVIME